MSERTLALQSTSQQRISYVDPRSHQRRIIPQQTRLLLRREQTRLLPLNLPLGQQNTLVYSTADLLGRYAYRERTWLLFYGGQGEIGEAAIHFPNRPADLSSQALWSDEGQEATLLLPFGDQDQVVPVTANLSLLLISRERAYRAKEFTVGKEPALLISGADDALVQQSGGEVTFNLQSRRPLETFTLLAGPQLTKVKAENTPVPVKQIAGTQHFDANIAVPALSLPDIKVGFTKSWSGFKPSIQKKVNQLASLPEIEIWKKGVTHYRASLPRQDHAVRLSFFADDYKAVYINGKFVPEASNRATEALVPAPCTSQSTCDVDIYYVDTGRPKEDLGLWRLDEKKGLASVGWSNSAEQIPARAEWQVEFADLDDLRDTARGNSPITTLSYSFHRPQSAELTAVWRVFVPDVPGLVYLNGVYMEHHEPGRTPNIGREGIYLPPSMLKDENTFLFVAFEPIPANLQAPLIRPEPDSIRKEAQVVLEFAAVFGK